ALPPPRPQSSTLFPYTTLFRSDICDQLGAERDIDLATKRVHHGIGNCRGHPAVGALADRSDPEGGLGRQQDRFEGRDVGERWKRSEEHTSELQSPYDLVCRLLL